MILLDLSNYLRKDDLTELSKKYDKILENQEQLFKKFQELEETGSKKKKKKIIVRSKTRVTSCFEILCLSVPVFFPFLFCEFVS